MGAGKELMVYGLLVLVCGPIVAWVGSWLLYAFGEMAEDIHAIRNKINPNNEQEAIKAATLEEKNKAAIEKAKREAEEARLEAEEKARFEAVEKARRKLEKRADLEFLQNEFKNLIPMKQPSKFRPDNEWNVKDLSTKQVFERYLAEDEWSESYRYVCYLELKNRLG
jgi:hypothetical protein